MAEIPKPLTALSQQELLDLIERLLPMHYLDPLKNPGPGYEVLQAYAATFARLSLAAERLGKDAQIATAAVGSVATGEVQLYRDAPPTSGEPIIGQSGDSASIIAGAGAGNMRVSGLFNMGASSVGHYLQSSNTYFPENTGGFLIAVLVNSTTVDVVNALATVPDSNNGFIAWLEEDRTVTVKSGTVVTCSRHGRDFITTQDAVFTPTGLGPRTVSVQAASVGYEWNVTGRVTAADGEVLAGDIDTIKTLVEDPPLGDVTIKVRQITSTSGGEDAALSGLGGDRGILPLDGENEPAYRSRVRALPDTISPDAFNRMISDILRPVQGVYQFIETWQLDYQTCWDGPSEQTPGSPYNPNLFVYDDPDLDATPFRNRWLDENDHRGGVIVVVDPIQPLEERGLTWDDTAVNPVDYVSPISGGKRAVCAFDVPSGIGAGLLEGAYDGLDYRLNSIYKSIYDTLQSIKAAGISAAVELRGE